MNSGRYIVIEGPEGVGKTTQVQLLANGLKSAGFPVRIFREPDSQSDLTARAIRHLTQDPRYPMNTRTEVLLYNAARSQSLDIIRKSREQGVVCICDRNYLTTLAIQFYGRGDVPEYETINNIIKFAVGDMEPDITVVLDAPTQFLKERTSKRYQGERFDNLDESFLDRVRAGYLWEANQRNFPVVHAIGTPEEVFAGIWQHIQPVLADRTINSAPAPSEANQPVSIKSVLATKAQETKQPPKQQNSFVKKNENGSFSVTEEGKAYLEDLVTSTTSNVYAFTEKISPITVAAAMARLSRRGDDMRVTLLDEFSDELGKDQKLLQRVITAYGDDSVQQLVGTHVVVEGASNLLTKKLEWGRLAAYLEQSTRYIYFDQKDEAGRYKYFTPTSLNPKTTKLYKKQMDKLFDNYSELVRKLTAYVRKNSTTPKEERDVAWQGATRAQACDAIRPVLPVATTATVGIYASGQALGSLIMHLLSDELQESRDTGQKMLEECRKVVGTFLERADKPDRGGAWQAYRATTKQTVKKLADRYLPATHTSDSSSVVLTDFWPHNELDIVADILYEHSSSPLTEIRKEVNDWTYKKKEKVLKAYFGERLNRRHKPGRALEKVHYSWDLVCDYGIFRDLQRHRIVDDLEWQLLTPRYGYDIPKLVEDANLSELFEECFDISLDLHSQLVAEGYEYEAQYATLLGHKMRWKVTYNAREAFHLHELRTTPQGHPGYRKLVKEMHEKLCEVHPLIGEAMQFVNQDEDPELTRLAAERYTQFKLQQLK